MHYPEMEQSNLVITDSLCWTPSQHSLSQASGPPPLPLIAQPSHFLLLGNFHQCSVSISHSLLSPLYDSLC